MKRNLVLGSLFAIFALAAAASAQKATDFSGTWTLDVEKSSPAETMIESQTITVTQSATEVKVDRNTKMKPMDMPGGGGGRGMGGPGGGGPQSYGIGTPVKVTRDTPQGSIELTMTAKIEGNKLTLTTATPMGERGETWTLNADGTMTATSQGRGGAAVTRTYKKS